MLAAVVIVERLTITWGEEFAVASGIPYNYYYLDYSLRPAVPVCYLYIVETVW